MSDLVNLFSSFGNKILLFFSSITSVLSYIFSIFKTLWFGLTSLLSGTWDLIVQVFDGGVFDSVGSSFAYISYYIGFPATVFISSLLVIIILRIGVAFVFKMFRLNIDYHSLQNKIRTYNQHSKLK